MFYLTTQHDKSYDSQICNNIRMDQIKFNFTFTLCLINFTGEIPVFTRTSKCENIIIELFELTRKK